MSVQLMRLLCLTVGDAEIEQEELEGVVDESAEQEFSFKDFVLR